jgi:flagellar biosynthesis anti-sigma factor FlgM
MKVQGPGRPAVGQVQEARDAKETKGVEPARSHAAEERVQVSSLSKLLAQVRAPEEAPDQQKIERLRESLRAGTFEVDRERVAEAMLAEEG